MAGLVTIEDVIEQIVGDIDDEFDVEDDQNIRREGERQFSVRGSTRIEEFNQFFHAELPDDEFDTVAGLVMKQFGRMPRRGETRDARRVRVSRARADRRRIDSLRVTHSAAVRSIGGAGASESARPRSAAHWLSCVRSGRGRAAGLRFAPLELWPLALLCPALLMWLWEDGGPRRGRLERLLLRRRHLRARHLVAVRQHPRLRRCAGLAGADSLVLALVGIMALYHALLGYLAVRWLPSRGGWRYLRRACRRCGCWSSGGAAGFCRDSRG